MNNSRVKCSEMKAGNTYSGIYLVKSLTEKIASNNEPYVSIVICDNSGEIQGNIFNTTLESTGLSVGDFINTEVFVSLYKEKLQIKPKWFNKIQDTKDIPLSEYIRSYPYKDKAFENVLNILSTIEDPDIKELAFFGIKSIEDKVKEYPAAKTYHHNYNGGLIEHTNNMLIIARSISSVFKDVKRDYLYAGVVFHDLMKIEEYIVNSVSIVEEYSTKGRLLGHITMGVLYIQSLFNKINENRLNANLKPIDPIKLELIQHLILSHHGELEYGSPVKPACKEAMLLHEIDMIDSRMSMYREVEKDIEGGTFSDFNYPLGGKVYKIL